MGFEINSGAIYWAEGYSNLGDEYVGVSDDEYRSILNYWGGFLPPPLFFLGLSSMG